MAEDTGYVADTNTVKKHAKRMIELMARADDIKEDMKQVTAEAKSEGVDVKILKKAIADLKRDEDDIAQEEEMRTIYRDSIR